MNKKFSVLTNVYLKPETKSTYQHEVFQFHSGDYFSIEEAEMRAELLRKKYPEIRIAILNSDLGQIIEIC